MNELIFLLHIALITILTLGSLRLGKKALSSWICLQALCANLFVLKQITLFGLQVTCSDVFVIGSVLGLNLMQEHYGPHLAKKTTKNCLYLMVFFAILSQIHLLYTPNKHDFSHEAYQLILTPAPRLLFASLITFFLVQKIDIAFFGRIKRRMHTSSFAARNLITLLSSQTLDTLLFTFLGLYGMVISMQDVIFASLLVKLFVILSLSPIVWFSKKWTHPKEVHL